MVAATDNIARVINIEDRVRIPMMSTLEEFRQWVHSKECPGGGCYAFLNGLVYVQFLPDDIRTHHWLLTGLARDLGAWVVERDLGRLFVRGALFVSEQANLASEPDLVFCRGDAFRAGDVRLEELGRGTRRFMELHGSPNLVVEIVSKASERKDMLDAPPLYFAAGVEEFWRVDARRGAPVFEVFFRGEDEFLPVHADKAGFMASDVLNGKFRVTRDTDENGIDEYRLLGKKKSRQA